MGGGTEMPEWVIAILSALVALILREAYEWLKRPRFEIDFEKRGGQKPYTPDYNDKGMQTAGNLHRIRCLRLTVRNKGKKPAIDCEAKLEISVESGSEEIQKVALHWSRRDPALYSAYQDGLLSIVNPEKVFAPISLNIDDEETVAVFCLHYSFSTVPDTDQSPRFLSVIENASLRQLQLQAKTKYYCKVTIYSSSANPKSFSFVTCWDGTLEGFTKAFAKS